MNPGWDTTNSFKSLATTMRSSDCRNDENVPKCVPKKNVKCYLKPNLIIITTNRAIITKCWAIFRICRRCGHFSSRNGRQIRRLPTYTCLIQLLTFCFVILLEVLIWFWWIRISYLEAILFIHLQLRFIATRPYTKFVFERQNDPNPFFKLFRRSKTQKPRCYYFVRIVIILNWTVCYFAYNSRKYCR